VTERSQLRKRYRVDGFNFTVASTEDVLRSLPSTDVCQAHSSLLFVPLYVNGNFPEAEEQTVGPLNDCWSVK